MKTQEWLALVVAVAGTVVFGLATPVGGQQCPEHVDDMHVKFWPSVPGQIQVSGSYAYVVSNYGPAKQRESSVAITDVSDPGGPRVVARLRIGGDVEDIRVSGPRLFFLEELGGPRFWIPPLYLGVVDVSDPKNPEYFWVTGADRGSSMDVVGDSIFLADRDGLKIFDVTDPSNPIDTGVFDFNWEPSHLEVEGGFAYVTLPEEGLRIIDVSDPVNPFETGSWVTTWEAHDLEVVGGFAYVADGAGGLRVIDVTDPAAPVEVATLDTGPEAEYVSVDGSHAIVGLADVGMWVIDISNPAKPRRVLLFDTDGPALAAVLSSDIVYILEGDSDSSSNARFRVVDLSVPDSPVDLASFGYRSMTMDMAAADGVQYIASGDTGLYVRDDSDPEESLDGFLDTPGLALGVTLRAGFALVADGHKGLRIVDVADASNMAEIGFIDTPGEARRVAAGGDYAYVADGDGGLRIIDVSVPEIPVEVAAVETTEPALDVVVWADSAYVVAGDEVEIIDVSDPTAPVKASTPALRGSVVAVADSLLYVGIGGSFHIWDVADPWDPILLVEDFIGTAVKDIELSAEHAYVAIQDGMAQSRGGVMILNVVDPYHPTFVGRWYGEWPSGGEVRAVAVSDGLIYLATGKDGVHVLDARCLTTYWVGIVAHSDGAAGSRWRSDVIIRHEAEHDVDIAFILHTQHGDITAEGSIGPRSQGVFEDVVGLFGHEGKGALEIQAGVPVNILSRVYNETDSGTSGAYFPGYRSSDCLKSGETVWLYGLRQMRGEYRTNINITNTGAEPGRVRITLYGCDGKRLMEYPVDVDPGKVVQELQPFWKRRGLCCIGWGFASVSVESGAVLVSATVIDSRTNHAMMVPMTR